MAFSSAYDTLFRWARRTGFVDLAPQAPGLGDAQAGGTQVYRLRHWPELTPTFRTAAAYRVVSLMSHQPLSRAWLVKHSRLKERQLDLLIEILLAQGALEVVDVSGFAKTA